MWLLPRLVTGAASVIPGFVLPADSSCFACSALTREWDSSLGQLRNTHSIPWLLRCHVLGLDILILTCSCLVTSSCLIVSVQLRYGPLAIWNKKMREERSNQLLVFCSTFGFSVNTLFQEVV